MTTPDILAGARETLARRSGAGNVFVLPARAFADFRLDAPPGQEICMDIGADFGIAIKNGKVYAKMFASWYDAFAVAWNGFEQSAIGSRDDPDLYLCAAILALPIDAEAAADADYGLIRQCMDLPYRRRSSTDERFAPHIRAIAAKLRAANARALAERRNRYAIRACAAACLNFFRTFSTWPR